MTSRRDQIGGGRAIVKRPVPGFGRNGPALGCAIVFTLVSATPAYAGSKKTDAEIAKAECASEAMGSKEVVITTLAGGLVGMALARDRYIKDCMAGRGYKTVPRRKKQTEFGHNR